MKQRLEEPQENAHTSHRKQNTRSAWHRQQHGVQMPWSGQSRASHRSLLGCCTTWHMCVAIHRCTWGDALITVTVMEGASSCETHLFPRHHLRTLYSSSHLACKPLLWDQYWYGPRVGETHSYKVRGITQPRSAPCWSLEDLTLGGVVTTWAHSLTQATDIIYKRNKRVGTNHTTHIYMHTTEWCVPVQHKLVTYLDQIKAHTYIHVVHWSSNTVYELPWQLRW